MAVPAALWLCWPSSSVLITALICFIYAVCRVSSSASNRLGLGMVGNARERTVGAGASILQRIGHGQSVMVPVSEGGLCLQVFWGDPQSSIALTRTTVAAAVGPGFAPRGLSPVY